MGKGKGYSSKMSSPGMSSSGKGKGGGKNDDKKKDNDYGSMDKISKKLLNMRRLRVPKPTTPECPELTVLAPSSSPITKMATSTKAPINQGDDDEAAEINVSPPFAGDNGKETDTKGGKGGKGTNSSDKNKRPKGKDDAMNDRIRR